MGRLDFYKQKHNEEKDYWSVEPARRVAIYARQSVDKKDSISIETQINECKKFLNDNELFKTYEDKGFSGKNTDRPAFQQMLKDVKNGKIYKIIVYKLDRFSRSTVDFYDTYEILKNNDCAFFSVNDQFNTATPTGRAMLGIIVVFAQLERETIQMRITDNYYSRIEKDGRWPGGPAPYGCNVKKGSKPPMLEYNQTEISAVKIMYDKYYSDDNISLVRIVRDLEALGYKGRKGKNFRTTLILNVLRNPIYVIADQTLYYYFQSLNCTIINDIEEWNGEHTAHLICNKTGKKYTADYYKDCVVYLTNIKGFITSKEYIKIQNRLAKNKQMARGNKPSKMEWLAGLVKCGKCGYGIRIYSHEHKYLSCFGKSVMHECNATFSVKNITFEQLKEKVADKIQEHISDIERIHQNKKYEWSKIKTEIEKEEKEIERLIELSLQVDIKEIATKIKEKQAHINQLRLKGDFFTEQLADYEDILFIELTEDEQKKIANELIEKVLLFENGDIDVIWKI